MINLYEVINNTNNKDLFIYIIITIFSIYYFTYKNITINIIFGVFVGLVIIKYIYDKNIKKSEGIEFEYQDKKNNIVPKIYDVDIDNDLNKKIIDLIFSMQDFYFYNPEAYQDFISKMNKMFELKNNLEKNVIRKDKYFSIIKNLKKDIVNTFHSLIYEIPLDDNYTDKFNRAHKRLETLLTELINKVYYDIESYRYKKGYDIHSEYIYIGPDSYKDYENEIFNFKIY